MKITIRMDEEEVSIDSQDMPDTVFTVSYLVRRLLPSLGFSTEEIEEELGALPKG